MDRHLRHSSVNVSRIAKADEPAVAVDPQEVYRLHDMEVEEVSLVDRAANKRKFLVVKRSDQMQTQVHPDGKGGFTSTGGTAKAGPPPVPPAAAAAPPAKDPKKKPPPPAPGAAVGKAGSLEVPPGFKEMMGPLLEASATRLQALADSVDSSKPGAMTDDGDMPGVPPEFSNELAAIVGQLEKAGSMFPNAPAELTDEEGADDGTTPAAESAPAPTEMQLRAAEKSMGALLKFAKRALVHKVSIQKLGAKMSKDRLSRLQEAVGALSNLVTEVAGQAPVPPAAAEKAASAELTELTKAVAGLASIVKGTQADVTAIKKVRGMPTSATVEAGATPVAKGDENYSWPMDMNREITRETVDKRESFFGDD